MPDSPTFAARFARTAALSPASGVLIDALAAVLFPRRLDGSDAAASSTRSPGERRTAIIDFGPGLVGPNGLTLRWLSHACRTRLLLISTSRASDLATAIYEGTWAAAPGEYTWEGPVLHLVNMWPAKDSKRKPVPFAAMLRVWANRYITRGIRVLAEGSPENTTSAAQIYHWRMWPYLYVRGVERAHKQIVMKELLAYEDMRDIFNPPIGPDPAFALNTKELVHSDWGKALVRTLNETYTSGHAR